MNIFDPLISGSLSVSGSGHISGDLTVLGTISATISGTTSNAISASHAASYTLTSSFGAFTSSYTTGSFTGSFIGDGSGLYNIPASGVTGLNLTRIADGSATASISNIDGLRVNTNSEITGSLTISGSILLNGESLSTIIDSLETESGSIRGDFNTYTSSNNSTNSLQNGRLDALEVSTSSLNTFTSSATSRLNTIESTTGSLNSFTSSTNDKLTSLESASSSIRTDFNSYTSSTDNRLGFIETTTGSLNSYTASNDTIIGTLQTSTSSLNSYTSSNNTNISAIHTTTGSLNTFTSSADGRLTSLESASSSIRTDFNSFTSSNNSVESTQNSRLTSLENVTGSYATTGSNIFQGNQTITGSLFISENLIVAGSSSINFVSQSTLNIGTNLITVNAQNPSVRFGGLSVIDSGSSPQVSGSILYDSVKDEWLFVHQNQGIVTSSVVLMGPETFDNLGNEAYLTLNRVPKGSGIEHLRDSNISDNGTTVTILSNAVINGTLSATGTTLVSGSAQVSFNGITDKPTLVSGSSQIDLTATTNYSTGIKTRLNAEGVISGSSQVSFNTISDKPTLVSGSGQISFNGITDKPTLVSGSSQISFNGITDKPTLVSGSSQITYGSLSGIPSGIVSGSSQITYGSLSGIPSGIISGSSQVSFGSISGVPSGLVSGSSQITLTSGQITTGLGFTPYNSTNPNGYITGISFANVSSKPTTLSGYGITDAWQAGGSWAADLTSNGFTRQIGVAYTGGEFAILTNNAQISTLLDGSYFAGEQGGFYSLNSSNQYSSRVGFNRDSSGNASFNASIVPTTNGTLNLGSSSARWNTVFTSDLSLSNGIGDYTIVEGEEKLYLYNNKNNKVYSFVLQEEDLTTATPKRPE